MRRKFDGFVWEQIEKNTGRAKVIGGWIVLMLYAKNITSVFIADKDHEWNIMNLPKE